MAAADAPRLNEFSGWTSLAPEQQRVIVSLLSDLDNRFCRFSELLRQPALQQQVQKQQGIESSLSDIKGKQQSIEISFDDLDNELGELIQEVRQPAPQKQQQPSPRASATIGTLSAPAPISPPSPTDSPASTGTPIQQDQYEIHGVAVEYDKNGETPWFRVQPTRNGEFTYGRNLSLTAEPPPVSFTYGRNLSLTAEPPPVHSLVLAINCGQSQMFRQVDCASARTLLQQNLLVSRC